MLWGANKEWYKPPDFSARRSFSSFAQFLIIIDVGLRQCRMAAVGGLNLNTSIIFDLSVLYIDCWSVNLFNGKQKEIQLKG